VHSQCSDSGIINCIILVFSSQESLRLAALHSDEESEQIAEQFLSGKISVEQFVNKYLQKRMVSRHNTVMSLKYYAVFEYKLLRW